VCKRWRDVVNSTPRIWSRIYFTRHKVSYRHDPKIGRQVCGTPTHLQRAVARSGSAPLDILVDLSPSLHHIGVSGVTCAACLSDLEQLSRSNVERWSSLEDLPSDIHSVPSGLFKGRFSSLCELTITESRSALFWAQEILSDAPALETVSLTIDGGESQLLSRFISYPAWSRVRRLKISVEGEAQISTKEIIQKCPKLEELHLSPADLTGIEVTPASSQILCKLSLEATGLPSILLELMIPPHYRLGSTVVVRPSRFGVVPGSIPGLAILFSSYTSRLS
jgi:hypothetical protein